MFHKVHGFFHKTVERRNEGNLFEQPVIFDNNSSTVLVEMDAQLSVFSMTSSMNLVAQIVST